MTSYSEKRPVGNLYSQNPLKCPVCSHVTGVTQAKKSRSRVVSVLEVNRPQQREASGQTALTWVRTEWERAS